MSKRPDALIGLSVPVVILALVLWEAWFFAALALLWCYVRTVAVSESGVLERTQRGPAWIAVGLVFLFLFPSGQWWWIGVGLVILGWISLAREPLWYG